MNQALITAKTYHEQGKPFLLFRQPEGPVELFETFSGLLNDEGQCAIIADHMGSPVGLDTEVTSAESQRDTEKSDFLSWVEQAKQEMADGKLRKVVLSRVRSIEQRIDPFGLFEKAIEGLPNAFVYLLFSRNSGTWLGASPERLINWSSQMVEVDSIAGTIPSEPPPRLSDWGAKELDEQGIVTESIRNTFDDAGVRDVQTHGPDVLMAGPVSHLHTRISGNLNGDRLGELVHSLHPTPAVGGMPKSRSQAFIDQHESHQRRLYTGFLGPKRADGSGTLYVNIRCMELFSDKAQLYLGCGITADSIAEDEWNETERKAQTWLDILAD